MSAGLWCVRQLTEKPDTLRIMGMCAKKCGEPRSLEIIGQALAPLLDGRVR